LLDRAGHRFRDEQVEALNQIEHRDEALGAAV